MARHNRFSAPATGGVHHGSGHRGSDGSILRCTHCARQQFRRRAGTYCAEHINRRGNMDWKLELVAIPVSDVDRAKSFYTEQVGFHADHDHRVSDELRFVQLTPPGSACSIVLGTGITDAPPGSVRGMQLV